MTEEERRRILEEEYFRYDGMAYEENQFYLTLLRNCQDLQEPNNLGEKCNGELVEVRMTKNEDIVIFNGSTAYELSNGCMECRSIRGEIWREKDFFIVDTKVERLSVDVENKTYTTVDKFMIKDNKIVSRISGYNFEMPKKYTDDTVRIDLGGQRK